MGLISFKSNGFIFYGGEFLKAGGSLLELKIIFLPCFWPLFIFIKAAGEDCS